MTDSETSMPEARAARLGRQYEGWAFTFCKAAFLALLFEKYTLLATSGLATLFYVLAARQGVREWRCFAKPPWVTLLWAAVFAGQCYQLFFLHRR
jgi:hypothetical protein